jgi:DNA-binding NarL/FixJ family response regulator
MFIPQGFLIIRTWDPLVKSADDIFDRYAEIDDAWINSRVKRYLLLEVGNMSVKLLIVDDNDTIREHIKCFVGAELDIKVIGEAKDGETAVLLAQKLSPDVVLMDINMPKLNGIKAAAEILRYNALIKVIILSIHSSRRFVTAALRAGISGYVLKTSINQDLLLALRAVMANKYFLSPQITDVELEEYRGQSPKTDDSIPDG